MRKMDENEAKQQARDKKGELLDSFEISMGTPSKGTAIKLKCYFDALDVSPNESETEGKAEIKVKNLLKIKTYLSKQGFA